ncbi:putative N-acetyltransferase 5 [Acaromyces ingoldii]|uniref:Putative N-acetyltransferase 5 n=1 Tax=Acaromyces ingoldii TaxID=215250 RepID=A0A316YLN9_9BASI|nr:putative N-acetyltransferase 5 [Acaromyces ingoldii]PWN90102.1 putative N-acetyltransferase 5 [Acaromyces ingoldii]
MSLLRPFKATDLFTFNSVNLDHWTETYSLAFYFSYLTQWPDLVYTQLSPSGTTMGYVVGKAEGRESTTGAMGRTRPLKDRHGHVTAITVAPEYRRLGLAKGMMDLLERASATTYNGYFVDLFVRPSNHVAVAMYEGLGYGVYRKVKEYYQGGGQAGRDEDGFDMRKALPRDTKKETVRDGKVGRNTVVSPEATYFEPFPKPRR